MNAGTVIVALDVAVLYDFSRMGKPSVLIVQRNGRSILRSIQSLVGCILLSQNLGFWWYSMKVVINTTYCCSDFCLSKKACKWLIRYKGWKVTKLKKDGTSRSKTAKFVIITSNPNGYILNCDPSSSVLRSDVGLIECIEKFGDHANGITPDGCMDPILAIVEVPDDIKWHIEYYGFGKERIAENYKVWDEGGKQKICGGKIIRF